ncbi:hypothetical protein J0A71_09g20530 [Encephalitozoon cuniculi]|nr:hypothetical protein J0A71_09g20530 [Encephalitozoon cuniculi]
MKNTKTLKPSRVNRDKNESQQDHVHLKVTMAISCRYTTFLPYPNKITQGKAFPVQNEFSTYYYTGE